MVKVRIIPLRSDMRLPGSEEVIPPEGVMLEPNDFWMRAAEAGDVRIVDGEAPAAADGGKKADGKSKGKGGQ